MRRELAEDREITPQEAAIVHWLLASASMREVGEYLDKPSRLRVVGGCDCGCISLDFDKSLGGMTMLADALALYPDGQKAGLILWGRDGAIIMLEVYEMDPVAHRMPDLADLRRWEDLAD